MQARMQLSGGGTHLSLKAPDGPLHVRKGDSQSENQAQAD